MTRHRVSGWICDLYDLDCVNDQHSHGQSVGKYLMVIRVKCDRTSLTDTALRKDRCEGWNSYVDKRG